MHVIMSSNFSQAKEKEAEERQRRMCEEHDNFTEIANNIHGDMLSENPDVAKSAFGPHRVVPDRWKGMSPRQAQEVREAQERQREERRVSFNNLCLLISAMFMLNSLEVDS